MPKTEYDLIKGEQFPSDYIPVFEAILNVRKIALNAGIYITSKFYGGINGNKMAIYVGGNVFSLMSKTDLDADFDAYLSKTHANTKFSTIRDPEWEEPAEPTEVDEDECTDAEWDDYCVSMDAWDVARSLAPTLKLYEDVIALSKEELSAKAAKGCSDLQAIMLYLATYLGITKALSCAGKLRIYVTIGDFGFIANW
jgi:hypothetical protein